ncbi:MAG TPA: hypothetical protein VM511_09720, partial [Luteolibacter sp.]|nr:hypothetical protein [Luteolibacter sp.]
MLRCCLVAALAGSACALAQPLVTAEQVHRLSLKESREKLPVKLSGVVTYVRGVGPEVVIQDATGGVMLDVDLNLVPRIGIGMKVVIEGFTAVHPPTPRVKATSVEFLGQGELPEPVRMTVAQLLEADDDGTLIECEDVIRAVRVEEGEVTPARLVLEMGPASGRLSVWVSRWDEESRRAFSPGTTVRVKGVLMRWKTVQWMPISSLMVVHEPSWVGVVRPAPAREDVAYRELEEVPAAATDDDFSEMFRVKGVVSYSDASVTVIGEEKSALWIHAGDGSVFLPGDRVEATGYPGMNGPRSELEDAKIERMEKGEPIEPEKLSPQSFEKREPMWMDGMRVRLKGIVAAGSSDPEDAPLFLDFGGKLIPIHFANRPQRSLLPAAGSEIEATGILEAGLNLRLR